MSMVICLDWISKINKSYLNNKNKFNVKKLNKFKNKKTK